MLIKKYLLLCLLPLLLSGESIVGKWDIDNSQTKQSIDKLGIAETGKEMMLMLSQKGYSSIECFKNKTCILQVNDIDSCLGKFTWKKNNDSYILTTYKEKLCKDNASFFKKSPTITIIKNKLTLTHKDSSGKLSFIYQKSTSNKSNKIHTISLENIKYNKIYKSDAVYTYSISTFSSISTYFYLIFTDKNKFYSLVTTQSDISSVDKIKDIIQKKSDEFKLSAKEQLKRLKDMPYSHNADADAIQIFLTAAGNFDPNKDGISAGSFNSYFKESDISTMDGGGIRWKPARRCNQITFMPNNTLSCDNGIKYTLLNKNNLHIKNKVTTSKNYTVDIDIKAEKEAEKQNADNAYLEAIKEMI